MERSRRRLTIACQTGVLEVVVLFLGSARDLRHRRAETLANTLRLFHWTIAKKTLELPAELRCAFVANSICRKRSAKSIMENQ
ncbi:MAG: hypothetical protein JWO19_5784, partial [Bryobacterales bacterium]|nr:hypothetical protein [Bryobacterales bacterium]